MVCEDGHFIPLVRGLLLHLDKDLVERGCVRELVNNHMEASFIARCVKKGIKIQEQCISEVRKHYHCLGSCSIELER